MDSVNRDAAFLHAADVAVRLLKEPEVQIRWKDQSKLERMTIGMLACHLGRQIRVAAKLLGEQPDASPVLERVDEHYSKAAWVRAKTLDDPANDRTADEGEAAQGYAAMIELVSIAEGTVREWIATGRAVDVVSVPWQGWSLRRADFLLTRMLEIVVHSDDLARSIGRPTPEFPDDVFDPVSALLLRIAARRHGQAAVISALSRRERMPDALNAF